MAPVTRASKRAALDSDSSSREQQATTRSAVPRLPTSPKKSLIGTKHAISLGSNVSAQTTKAGTSRKRQRDSSDKTNSTSKRLKKSRRAHKTGPPAAATSSTARNGANILSLPLELHQQVLSYTSARDAARLRSVCKGLNTVIINSSAHIVKLYTCKELSRLREVVNEFEGLKIPTDLDSLLEAVHVWTKRRSYLSHFRVSQGSMFKLMAHFCVKNARDNDNKRDTLDRLDDDNNNDNDNKWGIDDAVRRGVAASAAARLISSPLEDSEIDAQFERLISTGKLDYNEVDKLLEYSAKPQSQAVNHRLGGCIWPEETMEHMTFPKVGKLTPLLRNPSTHGIEFFGFQLGEWPFDEGSLNLWGQYVDKPESAIQNLQSDTGNERLVRYLQLPVLSSTVSCYYVSDSWARKQIDTLVGRLHDANRRQNKKVMVAPLLRAAILEHVKYF
jgi:hypothetical protein